MAIIRSPGFATNWQYFTNAVFFDANFMSLWNDPEFLALKERMAWMVCTSAVLVDTRCGFDI